MSQEKKWKKWDPQPPDGPGSGLFVYEERDDGEIRFIARVYRDGKWVDPADVPPSDSYVVT